MSFRNTLYNKNNRLVIIQMSCIPDGLFPKEELAVERWISLCVQSQLLCEEKGIEKSQFYPNQHSISMIEKTIGIALSNYRQAISGKGTSRHYEYVDNIIKEHGFFHWIQFKTDEDKSNHKWMVRIQNGKNVAERYGIPFDAYYPNQRSGDPLEKELGIALVNYRQALQKKGTHKVYDSVTRRIQRECSHWLFISSTEKKCLDQWRRRYEWIRQHCALTGTPIGEYVPNTKNKVEKEIEVSLEVYLQRPIYPSVNSLLRVFRTE
jgi:hypothetical protein